MTPGAGRSEAIVDRLQALHPRLIDLSLDRIWRCLAALGHPERRLPPVIHVAGTNGKGSTCAFLRAIAEAAGQRVHVYTSPHLVRFHERIRLAGGLVTEDALTDALAETEAANGGQPITIFEITTATALLLFSRVPADLLILEVGLGGRLDATNVVDRPVATAITAISRDHMDFLGDTLPAIAGEKAGILKPGVPCATGAQTADAAAVLDAAAAAMGAPLWRRGHEWQVATRLDGLRYTDAHGGLDLPAPGLAGVHQHDNAGIAIAALRAWSPAWLDAHALAAGVARATWPARLQCLSGTLAATLPSGWELWLDGGHNPGAAAVLAQVLAGWRDRPLHLIVGMKASKQAAAFLDPLLALADTVWAIAEPGQHGAMSAAEIVTATGGHARIAGDGTLAATLTALPRETASRVLVCGSLYLAGEVLKLDESIPSAT